MWMAFPKRSTPFLGTLDSLLIEYPKGSKVSILIVRIIFPEALCAIIPLLWILFWETAVSAINAEGRKSNLYTNLLNLLFCDKS